MLVHGYLHIQEIALMCFDECHHALKNHPYAQIMLDFYMPIFEKDGKAARLPKACVRVCVCCDTWSCNQCGLA